VRAALKGGTPGTVTAVQRAGGALNTNIHFHTLVLDGVFTGAPGDALTFQPAPGPSDAEVAGLVATIRHRVRRLLVRHGLEPGDDATGPADRLAEESPVLAGIVGASVQGRVTLGPRAGARVRRLGDARDTETVTARGPRQAHLEGFDLHANVWVSGSDRAGMERLCRYIPASTIRASTSAAAGRRARRAGAEAGVARWHAGAGVRALELLERLAAMTPRPETNLLICHGVLAARARWRARVVVYGRAAAEPTAARAPMAVGAQRVTAKSRSRARSWAALMHRAFAIDVLACSHCGGRLRLMATLHDPALIRKLVGHLGMARSGPNAGPGPPES
jgi:Putative transposase